MVRQAWEAVLPMTFAIATPAAADMAAGGQRQR